MELFESNYASFHGEGVAAVPENFSSQAESKAWTAYDLQRLYIRFRPHIESHVRRVLTDHAQVEDVVQETFLYLMTSGAELDSEVAVLKFLKWKSKMLALDVLRINGRRPEQRSLSEFESSLEAELAEPSLEIIRAEEAALVSLALAKLSPRQRRALLASAFEEKSNTDLAEEMLISENAVRQLIFRARTNFRDALVGEADIRGKSISQILSLAAQKAARSSGKYIASASLILVAMAVALGPVVPIGGVTLSQPETGQPLSVPEVRDAGAFLRSESANSSQQPTQAKNASTPEEIFVPANEQTTLESEPDLTYPTADNQQVVQAPKIQSVANFDVPEIQASATALRASLMPALGSRALSQLAESPSSQGKIVAGPDFRDVEVFNGSGLSVRFSLDLGEDDVVTFARVTMQLGDNRFLGVPRSHGAVASSDGLNITIQVGMSDFLISDVDGSLSNLVWEEGALAAAVVYVSVTLDPDGRLIGTALHITEKTL